MRAFPTMYLTKIAVLAAISSILMFIETPLPFSPVFLKMDISEVPSLLGAFAMGPIAGIIIEFIKNLIHLANSQTLGVGELANFIIGTAIIVPAGLIYKKNKTRMGAVIALVVGVIVMSIAAALFNYYILLPLYEAAFKISTIQIISLARQTNLYITDIKSLIIFGFLPFNIVKGIIVSLITMLIYKKVSTILHNK